MVGESRNQSTSMEMPRVNALVGVLADHDPDGLRDLQARYPEYVQLLRPGTVMGKVDANTRVLVDLTLTALQTVEARTKPNLDRLRARLARAKLVRLMGNIIATLTGAGLIAALVADADLLAKTAAVVNFTVTLFALVATHLETPVYGGSGSVLEAYETLITASAEAEQLTTALQTSVHIGSDREQIWELVRRANEVASKMRLVERRL